MMMMLLHYCMVDMFLCFSFCKDLFHLSLTTQLVAYRIWEWEGLSKVRIPSLVNFYAWIGDSHCNKIHCSLTSCCYFKNGYVEKCPVSSEEFCVKKS